MEDLGFKETAGVLQSGTLSVFSARSEGGKSMLDKPAPDAYKGQTRPITDFIHNSRRYGYGGPSALGTVMLQRFVEGGGTVLYFDFECWLTEKDYERLMERCGLMVVPK